MGHKIKTKRMRAGYYQYTDYKGRLWEIEHVTPEEGFDYDEWVFGYGNDPYADAFDTKKECVQSIMAFLEKELDTPD